MVTEEQSTNSWGPRPGEDWRAHRMRVFADHPEILEVVRIAKSPEHEAEIWRARRIAYYEGDPELQEIARTAKVDTESTIEEDEEDIRISKQRAARGVSIPLEVVLRELAEEFPDEAEDILSGL